MLEFENKIAALKGECEKLISEYFNLDSFVEKTNVYYPTDIYLLFDCMRCATRDIARFANAYKLPNW